MSNAPMPEILIVLVIYNEDYKTCLSYLALLKCIKEYTDENISLLIYDNSTSPSTIAQEDCFNFIKYYHNPSNPGVSAAYNYGYLLAKERNIYWLLLLDQDTNLPANSILEYKNQINNFRDILIFAPVLRTREYIISPSLYKYRRGFALKEINFGLNSLENIRPLNSGLCFNLEVFEKVNGYNENIKLDFSDFDFMRRVAKYYNSFVVIPIEASHLLSSVDERLQSAKIRYKFYCSGAVNSIIHKIDFFTLGLVSLLRGLKLSLKFKNLGFLSIYWQYFICKKVLK
jgi:GT2 family glycosyltransferase